MFHLIGVNHSVTSVKNGTTPTTDQLSYANCLKDAITSLKPTLVAEEQHRDWLKRRNSITAAVALACNNVRCVLCDSGRTRRTELGYRGLEELQASLKKVCPNLSDSENEVNATAIEIAREYGKREDDWLNSISRENTSTTIFICGDAHIDGFRMRLFDRGIQSEVIERELGMTDEQRKLFAAARLVLLANPSIDVT
jgi:hypothetical protein